jgi:cytochrome P450
VRGSIVLLLLAGIDTTWSAIGSSLWHLAPHPEDRRRLVAEPELLPTGHRGAACGPTPPVTMARMVARTTTSTAAR